MNPIIGTGLIIIACIGLIIWYDAWLYKTKGNDATISRQMRFLAVDFPIAPAMLGLILGLIVGLLFGHFFWSNCGDVCPSRDEPMKLGYFTGHLGPGTTSS